VAIKGRIKYILTYGLWRVGCVFDAQLLASHLQPFYLLHIFSKLVVVVSLRAVMIYNTYIQTAGSISMCVGTAGTAMNYE
jgi:hypothetical protein